MNAIELLKSDHEKVSQLFDEFEVHQDVSIAQRLFREIEIHALIEEQIFYPAVRHLASELIEHSLEEHNEVKEMIEELRALNTVDEDYISMMEELRDCIDDHVEEEEEELFALAEDKMGAELDRLGAQIEHRKQAMTRGKAQRATSGQ